MKVLTVLGTRPEAIKLAPVIHELERRAGLVSRVCVTGQHREQLEPFLRLFEIRPDHDLNLMESDQRLAALTRRLLGALDAVLAHEAPDAVLVQGDTTTALVGSLVAFYHRVPVGHVEAGLRSHDRRQPWPEELNRRLADQLADWLFAPTERAREALLREGRPAARIWVTGNPVIDALEWVVGRLPERPKRAWGLPPLPEGHRLILVTGHRRESFGPGLERICRGLRAIVAAHPDVEIVYPVHLNPRVRGPVRRLLASQRRVHLIEPLDYEAFVYLMQRAHLVLTDSGGVQEEAPALGVPVLVTREVTERPEGVAAGVARLVGTDPRRIFEETSRLLADEAARRRMARRVHPYGDGRAARRIVEALLG